MEVRFLADVNVVKLARLLRVLGYDAKVIPDEDDNHLIATALKEDRILLTRDTQIMRRRIVTIGRLKALLVQDDRPEQQLRQVVSALRLDYNLGRFTRCLECNEVLVERAKEDMRDLVPPYVFKTQTEFRQCPGCKRVYWRGTHWQNMNHDLEQWQAGVRP
ncbi:MAG: Mut7-C RNAse domain-containing protein [Chloroflexi bacterium]|nr:Mut7-C RNAse domain-containing protein [Chloroflexota bacterium]